jgi:hypothetical protein
MHQEILSVRFYEENGRRKAVGIYVISIGPWTCLECEHYVLIIALI